MSQKVTCPHCYQPYDVEERKRKMEARMSQGSWNYHQRRREELAKRRPKVDWNQVERMIKEGKSQREIADALGVNVYWVRKVFKGMRK